MLDLLIKNGTVIDPSQGLKGRYALGVKDRTVFSLFASGATAQFPEAKETLDVADCIVTPGLIDLHTHVFEGGAALGIHADTVGVRQGVTTVVDAGSSGVDTFAKFLSGVVVQNTTEVLAWLNIARDGLFSSLSELADLSNLAPGESVDLIRQDKRIRGIKVRMSSSVVKESGIQPLEVARGAAREAGVPLLVHVGNAPPALAEILDRLDRGDVVTHAFHGKPGGILDNRRELIPQARAALARGVSFDVGHGTSSFSFKTMQRARELGVLPYSISTDIYQRNVNGPVFSLAATMSKFLALGLSLEEVVGATTLAPARILGLDGSLGTLKPGTVADMTVFALKDGPVDFIDSEGNHLHADRQIQVKYTIKSGRIIRPS